MACAGPGAGPALLSKGPCPEAGADTGCPAIKGEGPRGPPGDGPVCTVSPGLGTADAGAGVGAGPIVDSNGVGGCTNGLNCPARGTGGLGWLAIGCGSDAGTAGACSGARLAGGPPTMGRGGPMEGGAAPATPTAPGPRGRGGDAATAPAPMGPAVAGPPWVAINNPRGPPLCALTGAGTGTPTGRGPPPPPPPAPPPSGAPPGMPMGEGCGGPMAPAPPGASKGRGCACGCGCGPPTTPGGAPPYAGRGPPGAPMTGAGPAG